jgi:hypothetical protein
MVDEALTKLHSSLCAGLAAAGLGRSANQRGTRMPEAAIRTAKRLPEKQGSFWARPFPAEGGMHFLYHSIAVSAPLWNYRSRSVCTNTNPDLS